MFWCAAWNLHIDKKVYEIVCLIQSSLISGTYVVTVFLIFCFLFWITLLSIILKYRCKLFLNIFGCFYHLVRLWIFFSWCLVPCTFLIYDLIWLLIVSFAAGNLPIDKKNVWNCLFHTIIINIRYIRGHRFLIFCFLFWIKLISIFNIAVNCFWIFLIVFFWSVLNYSVSWCLVPCTYLICDLIWLLIMFWCAAWNLHIDKKVYEIVCLIQSSLISGTYVVTVFLIFCFLFWITLLSIILKYRCKLFLNIFGCFYHLVRLWIFFSWCLVPCTFLIYDLIWLLIVSFAAGNLPIDKKNVWNCLFHTIIINIRYIRGHRFLIFCFLFWIKLISIFLI